MIEFDCKFTCDLCGESSRMNLPYIPHYGFVDESMIFFRYSGETLCPACSTKVFEIKKDRNRGKFFNKIDTYEAYKIIKKTYENEKNVK